MSATIGLIIACLTFNICGSSDPQIVGGDDAQDGMYPYQASLRYLINEQHFCGGAIIDERHIVTAAHCLNIFENASEFFVAVGSNYLDSPGAKYKVENFTIHENYNPAENNDDIGLIRVSKDIKFNSNTNAIKIPRTDRNYDNYTPIIVTGWGRLKANGKAPNRLQVIVLKGYSQQKCKLVFNVPITDSQLCTLNMKNQGMCNGDSGGPVVTEDGLIGLVSFGVTPCASGNPDVHTRVFSYKSWIKRAMVILEGNGDENGDGNGDGNEDGNGDGNEDGNGDGNGDENGDGNGAGEDGNGGGSSTIQPNVIFGFFVVYLCIRSIL